MLPMPRRRASKERRERERQLRSALRRAAHFEQSRQVRFRPAAVESAVSVPELQVTPIIPEDTCVTGGTILQIDGREFSDTDV